MDQPDEINPPFTRRDFHKVAIGAGAALATGGLLSGCGGGSDSPSSAVPPSSTLTHSAVNLHFNLSKFPADAAHTLRVAGQRIALTPHTAETLQAAVATDPYLANKQNATHFASNVSMPDFKPLHFSVTTQHPVRGHGFVMACIHIPQKDRTNAQLAAAHKAVGNVKAAACSAEANLRKGILAAVQCAISDKVSDNFYDDAFDSAKALVFHHPEIASLDTAIAAQVEAHMEASAAVANLASAICNLGPAYEHDPAYADGWCVLVPVMNTDGTPKLNSDNSPAYDYQFNPLLNDDISASAQEVLSSIKNDPALKGEMYTSHPVAVANNSSVIAKVANRVRIWSAGGTGTQMAITQTGFKHNVYFQAPNYTGSGTTRSFDISFDNWNFICYGLYVEYLDGNNQQVNPPGLPFTLANAPPQSDPLYAEYVLVGAMIDLLATPTLGLHSLITSPPTIFGVPLPAPADVSITLPDGAVSARLMLCGPGSYGKVDYPPSLIIGVLMTALVNFVLPMRTLYIGTGLTDNSEITDLLKQPGTVVKILVVLLKALKDIINPSTAGTRSLLCSIESLLAGLAQGLIQVIASGAVPGISSILAKQTLLAEGEEAVPFLGWAIRIISLIGTVGDLVAAATEIGTNPLVIDNTVTFTNSVVVTVNCDPANSQFPREAGYYEVQFTVGGGAYPSAPQGFILDQATRGLATFTVAPINGVPTSARSASAANADSVQIWFYPDSSKGFLSAHGTATFDNIVSSTNLTATLTITQNAIPLTSSTNYQQKSKLAYQGGNYLWQEGAGLVNPAVAPATCGAGLCGVGNIAVWVPGGMIGYTWQIGNTYKLKNVNASEANPNSGMKLLDSGRGSPTPVVYDKTCPKANLSGSHFYLDPVDISAASPEYHLRKLNLDSTSTTFKLSGSWGRFRTPLDRLAVHPHGYVVGISTDNSKMAVLQLPNNPYVAYPDDNHTNNAVLHLSEGVEGDLVIQSPQAIAISKTGAILILQGQSPNMTIKAFTITGNPLLYFNNGTSSSFSLTSVDADANWLDIDIDDTDYIFILSYTGSGQNQNDYHLDVYDKNGNRIVRNTGIAVSRMVVDKFRTLYTLNQEPIAGSPIIEPSVSVWLPNV